MGRSKIFVVFKSILNVCGSCMYVAPIRYIYKTPQDISKINLNHKTRQRLKLLKPKEKYLSQNEKCKCSF